MLVAEGLSIVDRKTPDDLTEPHRDAARTIGQTLRESTPAGRRAAGTGLSALHASHQRFRLLRPHAKGGLGVVSVAHDVELDREVAIKEIRGENLSDDAMQRFMMEAKVTGQLDHPGIPPVYAFGYFEDGRPFYVMRLIEGVTLKHAVEDFHKRYPPPDTSRQRALELRKLLGAFVSVCHTLRYAHSQHVLHRDIKPSNIMLGNYDETLVLDWGLAKCREESLPYSELEAKAHQSKRRYDDPTLTGTGSVLGTPHYMSPEQAHGQWESVNMRSEVYSLGATLYTILTGQLPFSGSTREAVLEQVRQGNCRPPREVDRRIPPELDAICRKAMALHREDRFATAGELASEIEHWLADEPIASYRESSGRRLQRWWKTHQTALATLLALLVTGMVAVIVGAFAVSFEHRRANESWQRAEAEGRRAERRSAAAREFVGRFLTHDFNHKLAQTPGSERPRLALLSDAINELEQWSLDEPADVGLKIDVAEALRERSYLFATMEQVDAAWSNLARALDIIEPMARAPYTPLQERLILTRLFAINDLAELSEDKYGPQATIDLLLPARQEAEQFLQLDADDVARRVALWDLNVTLAQQLRRLGRLAEGAELIDSAATQFEVMLAEAAEGSLEGELLNGEEALGRLAGESRLLQAWIAYDLKDYAFVESCLERTEAICDILLQKTPDAFQPLAIKLDMLALRAELSSACQRPEEALEAIRRTTEQIVEVASRFRTSTYFVLSAANAQQRLAAQELLCGNMPQATIAISSAIDGLEPLCARADAPPTCRLEFARAHRVRAEIALAEADSDAVAVHCYQARAALAGLTATDDAAGEWERLEFLEAAGEMMR